MEVDDDEHCDEILVIVQFEKRKIQLEIVENIAALLRMSWIPQNVAKNASLLEQWRTYDALIEYSAELMLQERDEG